MEVEQHAHGDEEQAQQDVAERADDAFHLVAVFGFGQHHARQEAAQRHREARHLRGPGRRQRHQQHGQREQLAQAAVGDDVQQRTQQPAARGQHQQAPPTAGASTSLSDVAQVERSVPGASAAARARNGTTAMSWNSTTLKARRP